MKYQLTTFSKKLSTYDWAIPILILISFVLISTQYHEVNRYFENSFFSITIILLAEIFVICLLYTQTLFARQGKCSLLLKRLSDSNTNSLRLKIDAYFKSIPDPSLLHPDSCLYIDTRGVHTGDKENPYNNDHTENLLEIIQEELSPYFTQNKLKFILNTGIIIPLFTTSPSSHQIFKMHAKHLSHKSTPLCTFIMGSHS
jgi:hypothetical protein